MTESPFLNEVIEERMLDEKRKVVLRGLEIRFPELLATPGVAKAIEDQPSAAMLETWQDAAFAAKTADDFLAVLRQ